MTKVRFWQILHLERHTSFREGPSDDTFTAYPGSLTVGLHQLTSYLDLSCFLWVSPMHTELNGVVELCKHTGRKTELNVCGIPWVNCAVLCVKDDWKGQFWGMGYYLSKLCSLLRFPSGMTLHSKIAQFNLQCIALFKFMLVCWWKEAPCCWMLLLQRKSWI